MNLRKPDAIRIVLCDGHAMFREALALALRSRGHDVLAVGPGGPNVVSSVSLHQPDVCLFDGWWGTRAGPLLAAQLSLSSPGTSMVLLAEADASTVFQAIDADLVAGAVSKSVELAVVEQVMVRVRQGERAVEGWIRPVSTSGS
jgi:DNA-binding NarL/FixJ family response regulator